jgi:hypothetical protein
MRDVIHSILISRHMRPTTPGPEAVNGAVPTPTRVMKDSRMHCSNTLSANTGLAAQLKPYSRMNLMLLISPSRTS